MASPAGKIFVPENAGVIRDDFLTDVRLEAIAQGVDDPPVQPGTDWYILGTALANIALIQYANLRISEDDHDVLEATGDALDQLRAAFGLPEVAPGPSFGRVVVTVTGGGSVNIADGTQLVLPNGLRLKVSGSHPSVANGGEVAVVAIDTGEATNLAAGKKVRFVAPPVNVETEATVSTNAPLTGGTDAETDERKRDRILNRLRNPPAGGNWTHLIEMALNALATVQYAFIYPALGGPASVKVVAVKDFDPDLQDFSRTLAQPALDRIRMGIHGAMPTPMEIVVQSPVGESVDVTALVTLPDAVQSGGNGSGWLNSTVWPPLVGGDNNRVSVSTVTSNIEITVSAGTSTAPVAGVTRIAWWSPTDMKFHTRLVTAVAGSAGAWQLTVDSALVDSTGAAVVAGDYISPDAANLESYGDTWIESLRRLGPGENTADANRLPRALRHPFVEEAWPAGLTIRVLEKLIADHDEISDAAWGYRSATTPTVPGLVATAPNVLVPRHFGVYSQ